MNISIFCVKITIRRSKMNYPIISYIDSKMPIQPNITIYKNHITKLRFVRAFVKQFIG